MSANIKKDQLCHIISNVITAGKNVIKLHLIWPFY